MWNFSLRPPKSVQRNVKTDEFFSEGRGTAESLVRESLQNCLDAMRSGQTQVRVEYSIRHVPYKELKANWLQNLDKHLLQVRLQPDDELSDDASVRVLSIEDFNTTGLNGSLVEDDENPYFTFWWKEGTSSKSEGHGGRHGVGKSVLWGSSKMRFFFGLTVRECDGKHVLTGQATLRPHAVAGKSYDPYGHFEAAPDTEKHAPFVGGHPVIRAFCEFFGLRRKNDCGLSVVIPFLDDDITEGAIIDAVVGDSFHQIADGQLVVRVGQVEISSANIAEVADSRPNTQKLSQAIKLSQSVVKDRDAGVETVACAPDCGQLSASIFDCDAVERLRAAWATAKRVGIRASVTVQHAKRAPMVGGVDAYILRTTDDALAVSTYVRGRITVPFTSHKTGHDAVALLVVHEGPLSQVLGDAEKPNHRDWIKKLAKSKGYRNADRIIDFCKTLLPQLYKLINKTEDATVVKGVLSDVFSRPSGQGQKPNPPPPPTPTPSPFDIERRDGGFVVRVPSRVSEPVNFRVTASYAPHAWSALDFAFTKSPIKFECRGEGECTAQPGEIAVAGAKGGFMLVVTGFDQHRDLTIVTEDDS